jgi:hypothetical protein
MIQGNNAKVIVSDMSGRVVLEKKAYGRQSELVVSDLSEGVYVLSLVTEEGAISQRFIKE